MQKGKSSRRIVLSVVLAAPLLWARGGRGQESSRFEVCATLPDLGEICEEIGGEEVEVTVFAKGPQDPHFLEAKPSFIKALSRADFFILSGLTLEDGWAPVLWQNARNAKVLPGGAGFVDASSVIRPLEVANVPVDRSRGDVHPLGNPHYLLDPLLGLQVAGLIRDRLSDARFAKREYFGERFAAFASKVKEALVGKELAAKYDAGKLALLHERGQLLAFLEKQGERELLQGWLGRLARVQGAKVVADHNLWPYFARRFGLAVVGFFEPKPGIAPTTRHLQELVGKMRNENVRAILAAPYFAPRHAAFVAENTGARILLMAHQSHARPGTEGYLAMVEYNVRQVEEALARGAP